jgi:hypothetical protein
MIRKKNGNFIMINHPPHFWYSGITKVKKTL